VCLNIHFQVVWHECPPRARMSGSIS
jgi:hypothetical protein